MSYESSVERHLFQDEQRKAKEASKKLAEISGKNTPKLSKFIGSVKHPEDEIKRDIRYEEGTHRNIGENDNEYALRFEQYFYFALAQERILGDPYNGSYSTEPIPVAKYDDYRHRIDVAATVHAKPESNEAKEQIDITFGIDTTISSNPDVIREKILRGTNDPQSDLPIGFSSIKYYQDRTGKKDRLQCVPRYCIGVDKRGIDNPLSQVSFNENGIPSIPNSPVLSFKMLYEISKQNELFESPLYTKSDNGTITPEEAEALHQMEILDNIYTKELDRIVKKLPFYYLSGCESGSGFDYSKIAQKFISGDEDDLDRSFACVITTTEELIDGYFGSDDGNGDNDPDYLKNEAQKLRNQRRGQQILNTTHGQTPNSSALAS